MKSNKWACKDINYKGNPPVDHILLHCAKKRILWQLLFFSLFGVTWVLSYSVKETLLRWHGSFVGRSAKSLGRWPHYVYFWTVVSNLWSWSRVSIDMSPNSLVSLIDWLGFKARVGEFFFSFPFPLGWAFRLPLYTSCMLEGAVLTSPLYLYTFLS